MKVDRIKQIFLEFVRKLPVPGMPDLGTNTEPQLLTGTMLIRGNLIMRDDLASGYLEALEEMHDIVSPDETWNKDAVDDLFAKQVLAVQPLQRINALPLSLRQQRSSPPG